MSLVTQLDSACPIVHGAGKLTDIAAESVRSAFRNSSVVLFRGFEAGQEQFRKFSNNISSEIVTHVNFSRLAYGDRTMTGVTPGNGHFFAHAEMGYVPFRPDVAWFYCEHPASKGGETTIYDGVKILQRLKTETKRLFEENKILFTPLIPQKVWSEIAKEKSSFIKYLEKFGKKEFAFEFDDTDCLHSRFVTSAITRTRFGSDLAFCNSLLDTVAPLFEDGTPIPRSTLHDVISITEQLSVPIQWQAGDVLMVDNSRFMHGRRDFSDQSRKILVRFSNIDF